MGLADLRVGGRSSDGLETLLLVLVVVVVVAAVVGTGALSLKSTLLALLLFLAPPNTTSSSVLLAYVSTWPSSALPIPRLMCLNTYLILCVSNLLPARSCNNAFTSSSSCLTSSRELSCLSRLNKY